MKGIILAILIIVALLAMASATNPNTFCPEQDGTYAITVANPYDCKSFFKCDRGVAHWLPCPEGLAYNEYLGVCDYPNKDNGCHVTAEYEN